MKKTPLRAAFVLWVSVLEAAAQSAPTASPSDRSDREAQVLKKICTRTIETWNGTNIFILYGKGGEIATNDLENQELTMLALHLLQICLVYINTLMIQRVLTEPDWTQRMLPEDLRALTPLIYSHVTPYGTFRLDMNQRLAIEQDAVAA